MNSIGPFELFILCGICGFFLFIAAGGLVAVFLLSRRRKEE